MRKLQLKTLEDSNLVVLVDVETGEQIAGQVSVDITCSSEKHVMVNVLLELPKFTKEDD